MATIDTAGNRRSGISAAAPAARTARAGTNGGKTFNVDHRRGPGDLRRASG